MFLCAGADLGAGVTSHHSHPTPGAAAYFMLLLCVRLKLFDVALCPSSRCQILATPLHPPRSYVQLLAQTPSMLVRFARSGSRSHPVALKTPRSANGFGVCLCSVRGDLLQLRLVEHIVMSLYVCRRLAWHRLLRSARSPQSTRSIA